MPTIDEKVIRQFENWLRPYQHRVARSIAENDYETIEYLMLQAYVEGQNSKREKK